VRATRPQKGRSMDSSAEEGSLLTGDGLGPPMGGASAS
jgi:hypothetical protein